MKEKIRVAIWICDLRGINYMLNILQGNIPLIERDDRTPNKVPLINPSAIASVNRQAELPKIRAILDPRMIP